MLRARLQAFALLLALLACFALGDVMVTLPTAQGGLPVKGTSPRGRAVDERGVLLGAALLSLGRRMPGELAEGTRRGLSASAYYPLPMLTVPSHPGCPSGSRLARSAA